MSFAVSLSSVNRKFENYSVFLLLQKHGVNHQQSLRCAVIKEVILLLSIMTPKANDLMTLLVIRVASLDYFLHKNAKSES